MTSRIVCLHQLGQIITADPASRGDRDNVLEPLDPGGKSGDLNPGDLEPTVTRPLDRGERCDILKLSGV